MRDDRAKETAEIIAAHLPKGVPLSKPNALLNEGYPVCAAHTTHHTPCVHIGVCKHTYTDDASLRKGEAALRPSEAVARRITSVAAHVAAFCNLLQCVLRCILQCVMQ